MSVKFKDPKAVTLAIDYGTSNSLVAATDHEHTTAPLILDESASDPTVFRSILYFPNADTCFYGQNAIDQYTENQAEGRLVRSVKKFLPSESFIGSWIDNRMVKLEDLIGFFLLEMRKRASKALGFEVDRVLLGRPAKFSSDPVKDKIAQYRLEKAAAFAGFKEVDFLAEPLAAAFELRKKLDQTKTVLIVDLGGGTSDFTVIRIGPETFKDSDVLAIGGISVAGDAVDGDFMRGSVAPFLGSKVKYRVPMGSNVLEMPRSLLDHICSPADIAQLQRSDYLQFFKQVRSWSLKDNDREALDRLFTIVEDQLGFKVFEEIDRTKRGFATQDSARFEFNYPDAEIDFEIARVDFDAQIANSTEKILKTMDETLNQSGLTPDDIDIVYCTGGTSRLRMIQAGLRRRFTPEKILGNNYFHSVIEGLAARARELSLRRM